MDDGTHLKLANSLLLTPECDLLARAEGIARLLASPNSC